MTQNLNLTYSLTAIHQRRGHETPNFDARIMRGTVHIGGVENNGCGGCCDFFFNDANEGELFNAWCRERLVAKGKTDPFEPMDTWCYEQLDAVEHQKWIKRHARTKTLFRLKGDGADQFRTMTKPWSPAIEQQIRTKYGEQVEWIHNPTN